MMNQDQITAMERRLLEIMDAVPFGNSKFQIEQMIIPTESIERTYRMICVNAHAKYTALKEADFRRRKLEIELRKARYEYANFKMTEGFEKDLKAVDIEEGEYKLWIEEKLIKDAVIELEIYLGWLEKIIKDRGGMMTREQFDASEPEYWKRRAIRQSERAMISSGTIDEGNIELLQQIGIDPVKVRVELFTIIESVSKAHLLAEEERNKRLTNGKVDTLPKTDTDELPKE